jgi:proline iminopeptidase
MERRLRLALAFSLAFAMAAPGFAQTVAPPSAEAADVTGATPLQTTDGVSLAYDVAGTGAPAVFVHGGPGSGSHAFRLLSDGALERHFRIAWLDQRGSGASGSAANGDYSLERQVADLEELRRHLGLERWTLVAYSFGGLIAQAYAEAHPERVAAIVHVSSLLDLPSSMESSAARGHALLPADRRPPLDPSVPLPQRYFMVLGALSQAGLADRLQYADDAARARGRELLSANRPAAANTAMAQGMFRGDPGRYLHDMRPSTAETRVPVLLIAGDQDHVTGVGHHASFAYPDATTVVLRGGHMAFFEDRQGFSRALEGFVAELARR